MHPRRPPWPLSLTVLLALVGGLVLLAVDGTVRPVRASTLVVTTTADSGAGSLRQAILDSNASPGLDTITFDIAGAGVQTIQPLSALPTVTDPVVIDGTSQPGYLDVPLIEISGVSAGADVHGLTITAGESTVRALTINQFSGTGLMIGGAGGNTVEGTFIGTTSDGLSPAGNTGNGLYINGSSANRIGGATAGARNVVAGNKPYDIFVFGKAASGNVIQGNYVGTNRHGTADAGTQMAVATGIGVGLATGTVVGGASESERNVIAGHPLGEIMDYSTQGTKIQGNYIRTDATGLGVIAVGGVGIGLHKSVDAQVGGQEAGARNVIMGDEPAFPRPLPTGISLQGGSRITVEGNYIGLNADGHAAGLMTRGIQIVGAQDVIIGGTAPGAGNVIGGAFDSGIVLDYEKLTPDAVLPSAVIQGNRVGVDIDGAVVPSATPGGYTFGILVFGAESALIGGTDPEAGNLIGIAGRAGVGLSGSSAVRVLGNSILGTSNLAIDAQAFTSLGPTANDPGDVDMGQNFPVITSAVTHGSEMTVAGSLDSRPSTTYRVELFEGMADPPIGRGEARQFLRGVDVTTDASGRAEFSVQVPTLAPGEAVSATATGPVTGTSEVSPPVVPTTDSSGD